jgi:L-lactate dehydrogenase complex protein LldG
MTDTRQLFLERVRQALRMGAQPGASPQIEPRGNIGYQGAGPDAAARFCQQFTAAGGQAHPVANRAIAIDKVLELVIALDAQRILLGSGRFVDALGLHERLKLAGCDVDSVDAARDTFFAANIGISGVDYLVAETGSLVFLARPSEPRSLSLLPPVHIAVASVEQIIPDLFDLFDLASVREDGTPPSCISIITGPSKTGDIELKLVTGVHGPGEIHVILIAE